MSPRKLSETDKKDILKLYRQPEETTSTLAERYGVSNSTISRFLKSTLLESEYEALIQQKRLNRTPGGTSLTISEGSQPSSEADMVVRDNLSPIVSMTQPPINTEEDQFLDPAGGYFSDTDRRRRRKRSSFNPESDEDLKAIQTELPLKLNLHEPKSYTHQPEDILVEMIQGETSNFEELVDEDLNNGWQDEELDEELDEDLDEDLDDDWDDEDLDLQGYEAILAPHVKTGINVKVLPLSEASLPKICYLVVDRAAELITRPLKEFSDLGQIPFEEIQQKTLPIFDNHRVARRFSNRSQRVIKVPDAQMLQKTSSHLQAKGITRLLIDGQVYSLYANN